MFYIRNCLGHVVGNRNGYKTIASATRLCSSYKVKGSLLKSLWETYNMEKCFNPKLCTVYTINSKHLYV